MHYMYEIFPRSDQQPEARRNEIRSIFLQDIGIYIAHAHSYYYTHSGIDRYPERTVKYTRID